MLRWMLSRQLHNSVLHLEAAMPALVHHRLIGIRKETEVKVVRRMDTPRAMLDRFLPGQELMLLVETYDQT